MTDAPDSSFSQRLFTGDESARPAGGTGDLPALLKLHFGHDAFRPLQQQIIQDALAGRDVFVLMPTGGGKSLCFQFPAVIQPGVTVVVSPLIALMEDQVMALQATGVAATMLNSSLDRGEIHRRETAVIRGEYKLVYLSPERLAGPAGLRLLERIRLTRLAIDEAHCISEWGHDFRPEYRQIGQLLRSKFPSLPITALTATATPRVTQDILDQLHLREAAIHRSGFERTNLMYEVRPKREVLPQITKYLNQHADDEGIIYCQSRNAVDQLSAKLREAGIEALPYHAGLDHATRAANQHAFIYGETRVMVATIAFGMGIDKPDVRFVIHNDLPRHLEGYYQETGRAGRDGLPADCILFYSAGDRVKIERFIEEKPDERERQLARQQLAQVMSFASTHRCRCIPLLAYFGQEHPGRCGHCDNCIKPPSLIDATTDARKFLSAVVRTGQRFGINYIIDVLRGADHEQIQRHRHQSLSVYGIGKDGSKAHWQRVAEVLLEHGQLTLSADGYALAQLTPRSTPVLRGEVPIEVALRAEPRDDRKRKRDRRGSESDSGLPEHIDAMLFDKLRMLRRQIATSESVPPYVVFSDVSLREMASRKPGSLQAMSQITGVGPYKLQRYATPFLQVILGHEQADSDGDGPVTIPGDPQV